MDGRADGRTDGRADGWTDEGTGGRTNSNADTDRRMDGGTDGRTNSNTEREGEPIYLACLHLSCDKCSTYKLTNSHPWRVPVFALAGLQCPS